MVAFGKPAGVMIAALLATLVSARGDIFPIPLQTATQHQAPDIARDALQLAQAPPINSDNSGGPEYRAGSASLGSRGIILYGNFGRHIARPPSARTTKPASVARRKRLDVAPNDGDPTPVKSENK
jgi:hypothetical protein